VNVKFALWDLDGCTTNYWGSRNSVVQSSTVMFGLCLEVVGVGV
jgi:hypothetical protein